ncbi:MAG: NBR1-Ig-like domain-containing protein [Anaerolineae bacterium]|nr:NBR1-Ig-like domain-containing protein [Anaerolineae bacterium]
MNASPFHLIRPLNGAYNLKVRFDDPANYAGQSHRVQRREGQLYVPLSANGDIHAVQRGVVEEVGFYAQGYGQFIRLSHDWYGERYSTWYGHLATVKVQTGDYINAGQAIAMAGRSGSATEICLFFTLQHHDKGRKNYVVDDVIDPEPLFVNALPLRDEAWWIADETILDGTLMPPNAQFTKVWRVRNAGTTSWRNYRLVFHGDHPMGEIRTVTLPSAAPGEVIPVSVDLIAPATLGLHRSTWMLSNVKGETFPHELYAEIQVRQTEQIIGVSNAKFVDDLTIPDGERINAGERFIKTWRIANHGQTAWGPGFSLYFIRDQRMDAPLEVPLPPLLPGQTGEVSVALIAPSQPGLHRSTWRPRDAQGRLFGHEFYAEINVIASTPMDEGGCNATVRRDVSAKLRSHPSLTSSQIAVLEPSTAVRVHGVSQRDHSGLRWCEITGNQVRGFIREDLLSYSSDCATLGLSNRDDRDENGGSGGQLNPLVRFGSPIAGRYSVTQEFGVGERAHKGADLAGAIELPIIAGGVGLVQYIIACSHCTDDRPNFASHGIAMWDRNAISDIKWGYGFGNYVVVRYRWDDLPGQMRAAMTAEGYSGAYAYVIYAHLHRIHVNADDPVSAGTVIGTLGNTGNSSGPHLHLEIRLDFKSNLTSIYNRRVINPREMFEF